ncbi:GspH/FimT family pseudopilin [Photobacterium angustum]|uniref:Type II secretion system protein H n=1 Tax=Photobacterium angustum TaxID=661 RepID=A0A2S7VVI9_PHOAN|nr:GspH/FimT family pseudopilin [Photobacterium angustum]PQJ66140.1 hypothetical protein BTO08_01205 [Photobacterium angustum]
MAREKDSYLHSIHCSEFRFNGFTLLELMITLSILSVLLMTAAPSFTQLLEKNKVKNISADIEGFLLQAKSESVMRNEPLKVKYIRDSGDITEYHNDGQWVLALLPASSVASTISNAKSDAIQIILGNKYKGINFKVSMSSYLTMDASRGTPNTTGQFYFYITDSSKEVQVILNRLTGRIRSCSVASGGAYEFKPCS